MEVRLSGLDSGERKKAVRRYFTPTPDPGDKTWAHRLLMVAVALLVLALAMLVTGLWFPAAAVAVASAFAAQRGFDRRASYWRRYDKAEPKPSDRQMDELLRDDIGRAAQRALQRLGLRAADLELHSYEVGPRRSTAGGGVRLADLGSGPIAVFGPAESDRITCAVGTDHTWRFSAYDVMVICPTGHHLGVYECRLDLATGRRRNEQTGEYHYSDVVAVATTTRTVQAVVFDVLDPQGNHYALHGSMLFQTFEVVVSSGDRSAIVVGIRDEDAPGGYFRLQESGIDQVLEAVRRTLREKKRRAS